MPRVRTAPRLEGLKAAVDGMVIVDLTAPKKQRHTAKRVLTRLIEEHTRRNCRTRQCVTMFEPGGIRSKSSPGTAG